MSKAVVSDSLRHIWLCADDYGISRSVNAGIRELIVRGRINATSVMVVAPHIEPADAASLTVLNADTRRVAIGLHLTLTAPFKPLSATFAPQRDGAFLPLASLLTAALLRRLRHDLLSAEIARQLHAFAAAFGQVPDFIDSHQHVHLFPQVRDAVLAAAREAAPDAWLRQCGSATPFWQRWRDRKGLLLDWLSRGFRRRARRLGLRTNPAFAGTYDFAPDAEYSALFPSFLERLPAGGLIMCHPGFVDAELKRLDPLTTLREREHAFFSGEAFPRLLVQQGVTLA